MKRFKYLSLQARVLWVLARRGKLSLSKILNALACYASYYLRLRRSGTTPILVNFELWNECNESCVFCRSADDLIYDANPAGQGQPIPKGKMPIEVFERVVDQAKSGLLVAIPYVNGEPLLSKDIYRAVAAATKAGVGTLIATNGVLLNERNIRQLLEAGIDLVKIHISGFTQPVHAIQHRRGDVERIKESIRRMVAMRDAARLPTIIMLDYILYRHNEHEVEQARAFADGLGILFNIRPGNNKNMEDTEPSNIQGPLPINDPCTWLWTSLTLDWNGAVYPCCDHVVWSGAEAYAMYDTNGSDIAAIWNGPKARTMRTIHASKGRAPIPICAGCPRVGTAFKF
jgi:sulfatase maturation enzyme AslB (radical SAM superfamily)